MIAKVDVDVTYLRGLVDMGGVWMVTVYDESE
jgi:hypothetical protein